jgi:hypothetical protein
MPLKNGYAGATQTDLYRHPAGLPLSGVASVLAMKQEIRQSLLPVFYGSFYSIPCFLKNAA